MPIKTPEEALAKLGSLFRSRRRAALALEGANQLSGTDPQGNAPLPLRVALGRPDAKDVRADPMAAKRLIERWRTFEKEAPAGSLLWSDVRWPDLGRFPFPEALVVASVEDLLSSAALAPARDGWSAARWRRAREILAQLCGRLERLGRLDPETLDAAAAYLLKHDLARSAPEEIGRLFALDDWLSAHPKAGCFVREIPVEGVHTKWFEDHKGLIAELRALETGEKIAAADFFDACGLKRPPAFLRVRNARPWLGATPPGPVALTLEHLASIEPASDVVLIVENLQTGLSLSLPETVPVIMALGWQLEPLADIPWLAKKRVLYAGDLDTHGYAMLSHLRGLLPQTESVLMTKACLAEHAALAVTEPRLYPGRPGRLSPEEAQAFDALAGRRLEQERIPLERANAELARALAAEARPGGAH